ncbi:Xaa-Pro peptidase family protein [Paralimibaculum aggregatum]|uniref:Xaa-Pro peptidase family protein n=1 Tax=Paralimibaculum aggregatum TaxID=3036245 RepID=A0ABQ6LKD9_9RHOB|nr:Xaa-Pro peptidase family protein [Limibaculum sp. NKW23]GMG83718.1 Xaa-Pro peptidase family protein [Limibaculum sp. NKW23]
MPDAPPVPAFPPEDYADRLARLRAAMAAAGLDALVVAVPENICWLTGLDHWGFFACHMLLVPREGEMLLVARAMERITVAAQVLNAGFRGHADGEDPALHAAEGLTELGLAEARLGIELASLFLTPRIADSLRARLPRAAWADASGMIERLRRVQSPAEQAHTRAAARAAAAGTAAAIAALRVGGSDREAAAECHRAMILAGSEYPGFGPFIRPSARLGEEHTTWRGERFRRGDAVFLEVAGSVARYQAPMGRLVYLGEGPPGLDRSAALAAEGMAAIVAALRPGATAGAVYAAWHAVAAAAGLDRYHRHHCGYLVGLGFPPSWTGGAGVTGLAPGSELVLEAGMAVHAHSWFTGMGEGTGLADFFISDCVLIGETGAEVLTGDAPVTPLVG